MNIAVRQRNGVTILEPKGKITIGVGDVALREAVQSALETGSRRILIDLKGVSLIDSAGIGELVSVYTTVTNRDGELKLARLSRRVRDILQITMLTTVFEIFDDEYEALDSFSRAGSVNSNEESRLVTA